MPRGGKRPGAGRKKGGATKKTRAAADRISCDGGKTPLEVLTAIMRKAYAGKKVSAAQKLAAQLAAQLAPYVHPRLAAVTHKGDKQEPIRLIEELVIVDANDQAGPEGHPAATPVPGK